MRNLTLFFLVTLLMSVGTGCATVDFDAIKSKSYASTDTGDTTFGKALAKYEDQPPDLSGFHVISDPLDALAVRLLMSHWAERTIDAQYYLLKNDIIGKVFFTSLLDAADRGVRVRLLIDDITLGGMEHKLAALSDHPNIELRLFNPFANRSFRALDAWDFARLNRRMHNKSFTVDNQVTLIGGRNIAEEYFSMNREYNFGDLDTLAVGPVVRETSAMFDAYWNHRYAVPYKQLSGQQADGGARLSAVRETLEDNLEVLRETPYADAVRGSLDDFLGDESWEFVWAPYQLVYDSPDKSLGEEEAEEVQRIIPPLRRAVLSAEKSLLVVSPYFVISDDGVEVLAGMQERGVDVEVATNSLSSSDHVLVHGGYAPTRVPLLKGGVGICEVRGDVVIEGTREAGARSASSSLHTKAFIVDERFFYMGSFNWDPRSQYINTELGIIIDSPEIAKYITDRYRAASETTCYRPFLDEKDNLVWRVPNGDDFKVVDKEPNTEFSLRLKANLLRLLPVRSQL